MPEVVVEIAGKKYRMGCEEGQEEHLLGLAADFNSRVEAFKSDFGEIGDARLTVMAGIALAMISWFHRKGWIFNRRARPSKKRKSKGQ